MLVRFKAVLIAFSLLILFHAPAMAAEGAKKKILFINSYHEGYDWSDGETRGFKTTMDKHPEVEYSVYYMKTQQMTKEEDKIAAGLAAKTMIDAYKPDLVVTSDDAAAKYLIVPYYKDSTLPFLFVGLNWDASAYGFPWKNVTGMLEVGGVDELLKLVTELTPKKDVKIVTLIADTMSERKEAENVKKIFNIHFAEEVYVKNFEEWKKAFVDLQSKGDVLYVQNIHSIPDWKDEEAQAFIAEHTKIISASINNSYLAPFCVLVYAKIPEEQGEWAANTALDILSGRKKIEEISVAKNVRGKIYVNARLAAKVGAKIPTDILEAAEITQ